VTVMWRTEHY